MTLARAHYRDTVPLKEQCGSLDDLDVSIDGLDAMLFINSLHIFAGIKFIF